MSLVPLGSLSMAQALPGAQVAAAAGIAGINGALPDILARIAALQAFSPAPISFAFNIIEATKIVASLNLAIAAGITPPNIAAQIAQILALLAALEATVAAVNANLSIATDFVSGLAAAGIDAYAWDGSRNALGAALTSALGPSGTHANALVLVTTNGATWGAMQAVFKTTP